MIDARQLLGGDPNIAAPVSAPKHEGPTDADAKLAAMNPEGGRWFIKRDQAGRPVAIARDGVEVLYLDRLAGRNTETVEELVWALNQYSDFVRGEPATRQCPVCKKQFTGPNETCGKKCQNILYPPPIVRK